MKRLFIFPLVTFAITIIISSVGCSSHKAEHTLTSDTLFLAQFYKEYLSTLNQIDREKFLIDKVDGLDSVFHIQFKQPINGYTVKMAVMDTLITTYGTNYEGWADFYFIKDSSICNILSPYKLADTIQLSTRKMVELDYAAPLLDYTKPLKLDTLNHLPFFFFDTTFDGEEEVLINEPRCGQRFLDTYGIFKIPREKGFTKQDVSKIQEFAAIYDLFTPENGYMGCNPIDEWTELDFQSKSIVTYMSAGYSGSSKHNFKIENSEAILTQKEIYECNFDSLVKRYVYLPDTTLITFDKYCYPANAKGVWVYYNDDINTDDDYYLLVNDYIVKYVAHEENIDIRQRKESDIPYHSLTMNVVYKLLSDYYGEEITDNTDFSMLSPNLQKLIQYIKSNKSKYQYIIPFYGNFILFNRTSSRKF